MGNKNKQDSNKHHGKFMKRYPPNKHNANSSVTGSRIKSSPSQKLYTSCIMTFKELLTRRCQAIDKGLHQFLVLNAPLVDTTSNRVSGPRGGEYWDCNLSAVWGKINVSRRWLL